MGNLVQKIIQVKTSQGMTKKRVDVIPHVFRERHVISADTGSVLEFHLPKDRAGYERNYQPGPQNMFKANEGWMLKVALAVYDVAGVALYALSNGGWDDKLSKFYKALSMSKFIHRFNEQDRIIDDIEGMLTALPVLIQTGLPAGGGLQSSQQAELLQINKIGNNLSAVSNQVGYSYPGDGLYISNKDQMSYKIEMKSPFDAACYGMCIDTIVTAHRLAQEGR